MPIFTRQQQTSPHFLDHSRRQVLCSAGSLAALGACRTGRGEIGSSGFDVRAFGARGNGLADDTAALQGALDACAAGGGGSVVVPAGTYFIRPIEIKSRTTLRIEAGAVLRATRRLEDYALAGRATSHESKRVGLVRAAGAQDIAIVGRGIIDGQAKAFVSDDLTYPGKDFDRSVTRQGDAYMRPGPGGFVHGPFRRGDDRPGNLVHFTRCRNVTVEGVTLQNSPVWTSHFEECTDLLIEGVRINTREHDLRIPNDDGIDIERCRRVRIIGCDIEVGDDPIAIFSSEDVAVSTCNLTTRSTGVRVGYNGGDIRNCVFENLVIRGAQRGLSMFVRDFGSVENVLFSNITIETQLFTGRWWGKGEPIHISALKHKGAEKGVGQIRNVSFVNIRAIGEAGMLIHGSPDSVIQDVSFDHVRMHVKKGPLQVDYGGNFDLRSTNDPKTAVVKHDIPALYAAHIDGLRVEDFKVTWDEGLPDFYSDGLVVENFSNLSIRDFAGRQAHAQGAAIRLRQGRDATIRTSRALPGTDTFVSHSAVEGQLVIEDNDTRAARTAVQTG